MTTPLLRFLTVVWMTFIATWASADDESPETAVRAALEAYVDAFNQRDVAALAAKWRARGEFVNTQSGERIEGRAAIAERFRTLFGEREDLTLAGKIGSIRWITPEVAQVTGAAITVGEDEEPLESTFTAILVHDGRAWLFDSIHETPVTPAPQASDQLESLEFLVGRWRDDNDDARITTTVRWGANRSFLVRSYTIERADAESFQGTQVIGWDARNERIRCWTFESDGSFGEGTWDPSEDGWKVKLTQTLADGRIAGATQVITRVDDDTLTVHMVGREVEGDALPSSQPVRVVRVRDAEE